MIPELGEIHIFWYGTQSVWDEAYEHLFDRWYKGGPAFDTEVRERFEPMLRRAAAAYEAGERPESLAERHALVLLFDQLSRNMFRGTAEMFATDPLARELVFQCLDDGSYADLAPVEQLFMAVALEHSENLADVERSAELLAEIVTVTPGSQRKRFEAMRRYNRDHLRVVRQFGRYPHRNELLGRDTTAEELEFLETRSYRWMRSVKPR